MRLEGKNLAFRYNGGPWIFRNLNLAVETERPATLLGDSGIGKSTLAKILALYEKPLEGAIYLDGRAFSRSVVRGRRPVQLIQQHPEKAVNPRFRIRDVLNEAFEGGGGSAGSSGGSASSTGDLLDRFGIERAWLNRYPHELSGGELQRFCVVRALAPETRFIIADEISAMFDPITKAQIWEALLGETKTRGIGLIA
jgi:peptide/nickel transport system ATP-binding protein